MKKIAIMLSIILMFAVAIFTTIYWGNLLRLGSEVSDLIRNETMIAAILWWILPIVVIGGLEPVDKNETETTVQTETKENIEQPK